MLDDVEFGFNVVRRSFDRIKCKLVDLDREKTGRSSRLKGQGGVDGL